MRYSMSAATRVVSVAMGVVLAFTAGCNDKALQVGGSADGGKHVGSSISPEQASKVLARVGDHTITLGDFVAALEHMDQFDRLRYQSPERRKELLREMVNLQLLSDEAIAKGYDKDPMSQQEIRSILRTAMMEKAHEGAPTVNAITDAEIQAYYEAHRNEYRDPERRRISCIIIADDAAAPAVLDAARKATTSAQWGALVRAKSLDSAAKANVPVDLAGDYGMVPPPGDPSGEGSKAPEEVRAAAFLIPKVGEVYEKAVKPAHDPRIYIVRLTQKTDAHERSLAEAERAIRVRIVQEKTRQREEDLLNRLRAEYPVQIDDAVLATVHVDLAPQRADGGSPGAQNAASPDAAPPH
jgi:peptidyl-prolyl cis-trans isomerase C